MRNPLSCLFPRLAYWVCKKRGDQPYEPEVPGIFGSWRGIADVATGTKHLNGRPQIPCQDAALVRVDGKSRPCALVADGAGSAKSSHFGAQEAILRLAHLVAALEDINSRLFDTPTPPSKEEYRLYARRFLIHASETIRSLASDSGQPFKDFHCTLLMVIVGTERIFWAKVGDGDIVCEKNCKDLQTIGPSGKGELANVTHFVQEEAATTEFTCGVLPAAKISGIALMTDGATERLVSTDRHKVAPRINTFLAGIRSGKFGKNDLHDFLTDKNIWKPQDGYTGDDKGIALLSRQV